jgi:conjugal transfer ATP-binding protein TraC
MKGSIYRHGKKLKSSLLSDCISIASFEEGFVINKDGSLSVGFEVKLFEEEELSPNKFMSVLTEFSAAVQQLPTGTVIQKLDIYWEDTHSVKIPSDLPFFHRKTLEHHNGKQILRHNCLLFLRFFSQELMPTNTSLALGPKFSHAPFSQLEKKKKEAISAYSEFAAAMPHGLTLRKLTDQEHKNLLYQYTSLTFHREPISFEQDIVALPDCMSMGVYLKSVAMKSQANDVYYTGKNDFGPHGVTSQFLWRLGHSARFPHMVCQSIEVIDDKRFRKNKGLEFEYSAQLKIQPRNRVLATHMQEQLLELEKILNERDIKIVKFNLHVLTWHAEKEKLQQHTDYIKSAFGKVGIEAFEEAEDTDNTFFAHIPGGTGFLEGCYMPLETAVAHLNFCSDRKGDQEGIILQNRHGNPIYYDPFKYHLDNQHVFVFGPSGSGKSFFNGKMIKDRYYAGHTMVVIDSGGTYRFLFQSLGGKYIEYNPESPLRLNPFLIKKKKGKYIPETDKVAFLVNFLAKMWKGDLKKNPMSEVEYAMLSKFLSSYYRSLTGEDVPNLIGFFEWLKLYVEKEEVAQDIFDARNFFIVLEPFTKGVYKDHFNALEVEYLEDSRLLCFELEAVKNDRKLYPLVVQVLFDYVLQLVATQPDQKKFIDIEEGWTMLDDTSESYIESFFRKGRKTNTSIRIITQNVDEIKNSKIAGAMKNNAATFMLLYNDKSSVRQDIAEFLGMDAFDMEKYASLRRRDNYIDGYREVFIKEMDKSSVWRVGISLFEHGILTSRPDERNEINKLLQKEGSIQHAVTAWVERIRAAESKKYGG